MSSEPILIPCEGVGCYTHSYGIRGFGICCMCGERVRVTRYGMAQAHQRDDIIARVERGDFSPR